MGYFGTKKIQSKSRKSLNSGINRHTLTFIDLELRNFNPIL